MSDFDLGGLSVAEILALHRATLHELLTRGIVRTRNPPQGDYAELLVALAYGGKTAPSSEKAWDVLTKSGRRLQVKSQTVTNVNSVRTLSAIRSFDFDALVIVLLSDLDLSVVEAREVSRQTVERLSRRQDHVNAFILTPNRAVMEAGQDVTAELRSASENL